MKKRAVAEVEAEKLVSGSSSTPGEREHHGVVSGHFSECRDGQTCNAYLQVEPIESDDDSTWGVVNSKEFTGSPRLLV